MAIVLPRRRSVSIFAAALTLLFACLGADAGELSRAKPIRLVGPEIDVVLDIQKQEVRILRFSINKDLPTGRLRYELAQLYAVKLRSAPTIKNEGTTTFSASDWYDGIGVKLKIELFYMTKMDKWRGDINITTQHEETTLFHSAQQLEVRQE